MRSGAGVVGTCRPRLRRPAPAPATAAGNRPPAGRDRARARPATRSTGAGPPTISGFDSLIVTPSSAVIEIDGGVSFGSTNAELLRAGLGDRVDQLVMAIQGVCSTRRNEKVRAVSRGRVRSTTNDGRVFRAFVAIGQPGGHVGQAVLRLLAGVERNAAATSFSGRTVRSSRTSTATAPSSRVAPRTANSETRPASTSIRPTSPAECGRRGSSP